jgi:hypothetical protein
MLVEEPAALVAARSARVPGAGDAASLASGRPTARIVSFRTGAARAADLGDEGSWRYAISLLRA